MFGCDPALKEDTAPGVLPRQKHLSPIARAKSPETVGVMLPAVMVLEFGPELQW